MSFTDRSNSHTDPVGPCLKDDPLVVELIHPHVTPGLCTSECKASDCPKTATTGPSRPARLCILPVPDMCVHLKKHPVYMSKTAQRAAQPQRANEEVQAMAIPSTPKGVKGAREGYGCRDSA